ncbi:RDD family protein [Knoellia sp. LjRoot47]|uniref:RDD family protein n=1 Tax=Knoellia sp. LjRoot47 TaxID=3342330 RepID=UPI003ECD7915
MSMPSGPGWYENPDNPEELRYFDGILWTANTTPLRTRRPQPPTAPVTPPAPQGRPEGWGPQPHQQHLQHQRPGVPMPATGLPAGIELAPYGLRVVAYLIDTIVVSFVAIVAGGWFLWKAIEPIVDRLDTAMTSGDVQAVTAALGEARFGYLAAFLGVQLVLFLVYHVVCLTRWGATPGKQLVGISVRRLDRPGPLDTDTAIRRTGFQAVAQAFGNVPYLSLLGTIALVMDLVWPIADTRRQALHDKIATTIVIKGRTQR